MLNPFHMKNLEATSESDSEIALAGNSRQLPSQLAAQLPTVALEKSSDIHIGPRQQNNEPVTVNEYDYITVTGENGIESLDQYPYDDIYITAPQTSESGRPVGVALKQRLKNVMTFQKQACLRNPYVWSLFVLVLVAAIIIALILSMSQAESNSAPSNACDLPREVGPCSDRLTQWYYDRNTDACYEFDYGGCQGNANRFSDRQQCEEHCKVITGSTAASLEPGTLILTTHAPPFITDICSTPVDPGPCTEEHAAWYFNSNTRECQAFIYGGCGGNANRFESEKQCERHCGSFKDQVLLEVENKEVYVNEGERSVRWVVNVTASSQPKLVWYGPNCKVLEGRDGSIKFEVHTSPTGTELKLNNISLADRGVYRLQASNGEGEEWAYCTLNVKGKIPSVRHHVVVCYVSTQSHKLKLGDFTLDDIDPTLCTHLVYDYAVLKTERNAIESADPAYDLEENNGTGAYRKMTSLKRDYPHLKVLLCMAGWEISWPEKYSELAASPSRRKALVTNVSEFLRKYNFDGLDLVWRFPAEGKRFPADKENFVSLLKEFRKEFDKFGLLLTAQLGVKPDTLQRSYDIPAFSQYLHYMFALCYNYYGNRYSLTAPHAPLYLRKEDDILNVESSINTLLRKGADRNKLVLGLTLDGRIFKLKNPEAGVGFQKESECAGMPGPYVNIPVFWVYNVICLEVDNPTSNWTKYWDNVTHTPYASKDDQFISYDDAMSLTDKVELAVREKLAGVMVDSLDKDDIHGRCTFGSSASNAYPLMRAINNALDNSESWEKVPCPSRSSATLPVN